MFIRAFKTKNKVYKQTTISGWLFKRSKNMSKQNQVRHRSNCAITVDATVPLDGSKPNVPYEKRKEAAKRTLYLNRI
jgi:hypothetical protein